MRAERLDPTPAIPMLGYSVDAAIKAAQSIPSPGLPTAIWRHDDDSGSTIQLHHTSHCRDLESLIQLKMGGLEEKMGGLMLDDFGRHN
jgi:hypothetical protein